MGMIQKRYYLFVAGVVLVILSAILSIATIFTLSRELGKQQGYLATSAIDERLSGVFAAINNFPGSAGHDLLFLRTLASISAMYDTNGAKNWRSAHQDLQTFLDRNNAYDELYLSVDTIGCTLNVRRTTEENGNSGCESADAPVRQALDAVARLPQGTVYVSPLVAFTRTVSGQKETIPALLYGTRVSAPGSKTGAIVAVVNTNYFLDDIRRLKRDDEAVYLVHQDGSYIANPDSSREKSSGSNANFYTDYGDLPKGALGDPSTRHFETASSIFTFLRITPTADNFTFFDSGSNADTNSDFWVLVAVSNKTSMSSGGYGAYFGIIVLILLAHVILIFFLHNALMPWHRSENSIPTL